MRVRVLDDDQRRVLPPTRGDRLPPAPEPGERDVEAPLPPPAGDDVDVELVLDRVKEIPAVAFGPAILPATEQAKRRSPSLGGDVKRHQL